MGLTLCEAPTSETKPATIPGTTYPTLTYTKNNKLWARMYPTPSCKNLELAPRQNEKNNITQRVQDAIAIKNELLEF